LVTLTGPGGTGKTRLGLQVAAETLERFPDGTRLVALAPLADPALVPQTVATALGVREGPGRPALMALTDYLHSKSLLLILDNCEHLVEACAQLVDALLHGAPNLEILASSREALGIAGEASFRVPPLSLPDARHLPPVEALSQYEAVRLFTERAALALPDFALTDQIAAAVAQVCQRLDGIPLAIELAAARVRVLAVEEIAARLDDRFRLLTGGSRTALPRQQTLRATMDWSYGLLSEAERTLFGRLAVFAGGWTLDAAETVCAGEPGGRGAGEQISLAPLPPITPADVLDLLTRLVDKSLVIKEEQGGQSRYHRLETVQQYAREKLLESGEVEQVRSRHLNYFLRLAEEAELKHYGPEQLTWLDRLETEHDNLRAALEWSLTAEQEAEAGLRLAGALAAFWRTRSYFSEGRERLSAALSQAESLGRTAARAKALEQCAMLAHHQSDWPASRSLWEESLAISRELGPSGRRVAAYSLIGLGRVATEVGDYETPAPLFEQALATSRELNDFVLTGYTMQNLGWAALRSGNLDVAGVRLQEALAAYRKAGYRGGIAISLLGLGEVEARRGELGRATQLLEESLAVRHELGWKWGIGISLGSLGWVAMRQRDFARTRALLGESLAVRKDIGDRGGMAWCLERLAEVALSEDEAEKAAQVFGAAESLREATGSAIDPADQPEYQRYMAALRSQLGETAFAAAWTEGRVMPLEQAIAFALEG